MNSKKNYIVTRCLAALAFGACVSIGLFANAATADVTGLVPTLWWDFETKPNHSQLPGANKGSASGFTFTGEGTATYVAGITNGWALDSSKFTPYSSKNNSFSTAGGAFTVSFVMNLGTVANGITLNLRNETGARDLIIRRGSAAGALVVGIGPQAQDSTDFLGATFDDGDSAWHLVSVVIRGTGTELYVDGVLADSSAATLWSASGNASRLQFGSHLGGLRTNEIKGGGCIDDLRVHDAALTSAQMKAIAIEYGVVTGDVISVSTAGEPEVGKDFFTVPWSLSLGEDFTASAAIVHGSDAALSTPTTNLLGSALSAGDYTASLTNLASGTTYWWKIVASNGVNWAETSVDSFHTLDVIVAADFDKRIPITVSGYSGASTLTNFPVLVRLAVDSPGGFDYANCAADGADLRFADADGLLCPHEIDSWDTNGISYVWVRMPRLSGTDTQFTLYYGAAPAGLPAVNPADVWLRYAVVIHGGASLTNAVGNGLSVTAGSASVTANAIAGEVGGGISKSTANSIGLNVGNPSSVLSSSGRFSVSGWFRREGNGGKNNGTHILVGGRSNWSSPNGFLLIQEAGTYISVAYAGSHSWTSGSYTLSNQTWGHVAFAYESDVSLASYFNGNPDQTKSNPTTLVNATEPYWTFGSYGNRASEDSFIGDMDELRVFDGVASADWIKAEYDSVAGPASFAVCGRAESTDEDAPVFGTCDATVADNDVTFSVQLESLAAPAAISVFYRAENAASFTELSLGTLTATGTPVSVTASDLDVGTYVWYAQAVSTIDGTGHVATTVQGTFAVTHAKELASTYKRFTATIGYEGAPATNVPVLLRLSESINGFRYADVTESGFEILDENGSLIPYDIDTWDTNGVSLVWVTVPIFSAGSELTIRYGTAFANPPLAASGVWGGYVGVWHLNATNGVSAYGSYPNSTATPGIDGQKAQASIANEEGVFGKSVKICDAGAATGEFKKGGVFVPDSGNASPLDLDGTFAISGWFKHKDQNYYYDHMFYKRQNSNNGSSSPAGAFAIEMTGGNTAETKIDARGAQDSLTAQMTLRSTMASTWAHLTFVYNGTTLSVYQNGALVKDQVISKATDNNSPLAFGNNATALPDCLTADGDCCWCGWIDEVRLSDGVPSADWIAAEYAAMTDASVVSFGRVSTLDVTSPVLAMPTVARNQDGSFTVSVVASGNAPASVFCTIDGTDYMMTTADAELPMTFSATVSGLADGTYATMVSVESTMGNVIYSPCLTAFHVGALTVTNISDAEEGSLTPGVFRVSRADADATGFPALTFDVAFAGDGLAAVVAPVITSATIPAGAAYVDISFTPILSDAVHADADITLAVSGTNIGMPSSGTLTVVNADYDVSVRYVATDGADTNHGGTPELPKKTIASALSSLANISQTRHCTVHVAPGLYPISSPLIVTNAISVLGGDADPSRTIVSNTAGGGWGALKRVFTINHADALVANLTMQKGYVIGSDHGGNFNVGSAGGTVSNCVVEAGNSNGNLYGAGGRLSGGLVTHTVFRKNVCSSGMGNWQGQRGAVLELAGSSRAENCLLVDNPPSQPVYLILLDGSSVMRNCTIADTVLKSTNEYCKVFTALRINSVNATALNTVIAGVTNAVNGAACPPTGAGVSNFQNGAFDGDATGLPEGTITGTAAQFFKDQARGDYRPKMGGPLVGTGANYDGMADVDLSGTHKRLVGRVIDIGAYEGEPEMTMLILK